MNEFHVKSVRGKVYFVKAQNGEAAKKHVIKKYNVKVLSVHLRKKPLKPVLPPITKPKPIGPGPQPPTICNADQLEEIQTYCNELGLLHITLRQILAAVNYFIDKGEWDAPVA